MRQWGADRGVILHFINSRKPNQNAQIESLNGRIRDEFLNAHSFPNIYSARQLAALLRDDYNETRPHSSLGYLTPKALADAHENNPTLPVISGVKHPLRSAARRRIATVALTRSEIMRDSCSAITARI